MEIDPHTKVEIGLRGGTDHGGEMEDARGVGVDHAGEYRAVSNVAGHHLQTGIGSKGWHWRHRIEHHEGVDRCRLAVGAGECAAFQERIDQASP